MNTKTVISIQRDMEAIYCHQKMDTMDWFNCQSVRYWTLAIECGSACMRVGLIVFLYCVSVCQSA